jgi:hypothetical protein
MKRILGVFLMCMAATVMADEAVQRLPSAVGAEVGFSNLADGDVIPPAYTVKFSIAGMGIAPAGVEIDNTGHFHLLIDLAELPDLDQPLPANAKLIHFGKGEAETKLALPEGQHRLQLVLADYRHIPHDPPVVSDPISITISADAPMPEETEKN